MRGLQQTELQLEHALTENNSLIEELLQAQREVWISYHTLTAPPLTFVVRQLRDTTALPPPVVRPLKRKAEDHEGGARRNSQRRRTT